MGRWHCFLLIATTHLPAQVPTAPAVGVVVDAAGHAVAGAVVELWHFHGPDLRHATDLPLPWQRVAATRTGTDGRFGLQGPLGSLCQLRVEHAAAATYRRTLRLAGGQLRVELAAPCVLHGRVATTDGRPAAARIAVDIDDVEWVETVVDAAGVYRIERLPPGTARIRVLAAAAISPTDEWLPLDPATPLAHSPVLEPGRVVTGRVVDAATGAPLAGAALGERWSTFVRTRSAADGTFTFPGARRPTAVQAMLGDYIAGCGAALPQEGSVRIALWPGTTVTGRVCDEHGAALADAFVWAITAEQSTQTSYQSVVAGRSDADGRFTLGGCGYDEQIPIVLATAPGRAIVAREGAHKLSPLDIGELCIPPARLLRGVVVDAYGAPVGGVDVQLWGNNEDRWVAPAGRPAPPRAHDPYEVVVGWRYGGSDASGCFAFGELPPGRYDLQVLDPSGKVLAAVADIAVGAGDPERFVVRLP